MFYAYETQRATFKGFKSAQKEISDLTKTMKQLQLNDCAAYYCNKFSIDREYYAPWFETGDPVDFAELVVLYLGEETKLAIEADVRQMKQVLS